MVRAQRLTASRQQSGLWPSLPESSRLQGAQRLTASRQQSATWQSVYVIQSDMCSTPYGITATIRFSLHLSCTDSDGAQRLTASRQQSDPIEALRNTVPLKCSTPYGITATIRIGAVGSTGNSTGPVLNALRHHGNNQAISALFPVADNIPVLNALRHHGNNQTLVAKCLPHGV